MIKTIACNHLRLKGKDQFNKLYRHEKSVKKQHCVTMPLFLQGSIMPIQTIQLDLSRFRDQVEMFDFLQSQDIYTVIELHPNSPRPLVEKCLQEFPKNLYLKFDDGFDKDELKTLVVLIKPATSFIPNAVHFAEIIQLIPENVYLVPEESQGLFFSKEAINRFLVETHPFASGAFIINLLNHLKGQIFYFHEATPHETMSAVLSTLEIKFILNRNASFESQRMQIQSLRPKSSWMYFMHYPLEMMRTLVPNLRAGCKFEIHTLDLDYLKALVTLLPRGVIYSPMASIPVEFVKESLKHLRIGTLFQPSADLSSAVYQELCQTYAALQEQKLVPIIAPKVSVRNAKEKENVEPKKKKARIVHSPSIDAFFKPIDASHSGPRLSLSGK
jgi:hypothetical protein